MKNSHLKNSLIAAGIAVFAGVVTLGANVAISATTPTQTPAAAGLVGPTFSGLDVYGDADIGGDLTVSSSSEIILSNPVTDVSLSAVNGALKILGDTVISHILTVNAAIDAQSYITNTKTQHLTLQAGNIDLNGITTLTKDLSVSGSTTLNGNLTSSSNIITTGDLDMKNGAIKNTTSTFSQLGALVGNPVKIADSLAVTGSTITTGKTQANGGLDVNGDKLAVSTEAQFSGGISMYGGDIHGAGVAPVVIGSDLYANKNITSEGEIKASTWLKTKDFQSTGALWSDGSAYFKHLEVFNEGVGSVFMESGNIKASGSIKASGDLTIGKDFKDQKFLVHTRPNGNGDFLQITTDKADGNWDWSNGIIMKRATAEGSPSTQFHVNGKVTSATGFGTYTFRESIYKTLGANATGYVYASCNAGEQIISCYGNAYSSVPTVGNFYSGETYDVNMTALYPYNGQCEANYKNTTGSNRYIKSGALCLNPSL